MGNGNRTRVGGPSDVAQNDDDESDLGGGCDNMALALYRCVRVGQQEARDRPTLLEKTGKTRPLARSALS